MHQLHMPLQSGSDKILRAMRRSYRSAKFLDILRKVREAMPDAQISTDIIVGFPWRDGRGFRGDDGCGASGEVPVGVHIRILAASRNPGRLKWSRFPHEVVQERFDRLVKLQEQITEEELAKFGAATSK